MNPILAALGVESEADGVAAVGQFTNFLTEIRACTGTGTFAEALAAVKDAQAFAKSVEELTGKKGAEALGSLNAWKDGAESAAAYKSELEGLRSESEKSEVKATLDSIIEGGRLEPAKREKAEAVYAKTGIEGFRAYVEALPDGPTPGNSNPGQPDPSDALAVNEDDRYVAKLFGRTEDDIKRAKKAWNDSALDAQSARVVEPLPQPRAQA